MSSERVATAEARSKISHPCYTTQESAFFQKAYIKRPDEVEFKRINGEIVNKPTRNPILGDKSARKNYSDWEYYPPAMDPKSTIEKLNNINDSDTVPLIAQFETQKKKFQEEEQKQKKLKEAMKTFYVQKQTDGSNSTGRSLDSKHNNTNNKQKSMSPSMENPSNLSNFMSVSSTTQRDTDRSHSMSNRTARSGIDSQSQEIESGRYPSDRNSQYSSRNNSYDNNIHKKEPKKSLTDYRVTSLRSLSSNHPEIVSNWRAQRAAEYIKTLQQREAAKLDAELFVTTRTSRSGELATIDTERAKEKLTQLNHELSKTNQQIAKQELKIGLNNKKFGHVKKHTTVASQTSHLTTSKTGLIPVTDSARKYIVLGYT
mmetsp:Transcript_24335/g.24598  ORF Transcript_24335/g.24598 Transcript_24335/m.24598 type:complete len:372 (-) Transcript_24335:136-1251(-)